MAAPRDRKSVSADKQTVDETVQGYADYLAGTLSLKTSDAYGGAVRRYGGFTGDKPVGRTSLQDVVSYKAILVREQKSTSTIAVTLNALVSYYTYMRKVHGVSPIDVMDIRDLIPRVSQKIPDALEAWQQSELREKIEDLNDLETQVLVELLLFVGGRIDEVLKLTRESFSRGQIFVAGEQKETLQVKFLGKGKKERLIPLLPSVADHVLKYMSLLDLKHPKGWERLFDMHYTTALRIAKKAGKLAGVSLTPHVLRHTFATNLVEKEVDIRVIADLLGHASLNTTMRYAKVGTKVKRDAISKLVEDGN